jgi:hypothetical protein
VIEHERLAALSLRQLARRVGVSHVAPVHHFGDKVGLTEHDPAELARSIGSYLLPSQPASKEIRITADADVLEKRELEVSLAQWLRPRYEGTAGSSPGESIDHARVRRSRGRRRPSSVQVAFCSVQRGAYPRPIYLSYGWNRSGHRLSPSAARRP